jgi:hypothetical protein
VAVKFVSISVSVVAVAPSGNVVLYFAALDEHGEAWWWDTSQPHARWQRLPPHPGPTNGRRRKKG